MPAHVTATIEAEHFDGGPRAGRSFCPPLPPCHRGTQFKKRVAQDLRPHVRGRDTRAFPCPSSSSAWRAPSSLFPLDIAAGQAETEEFLPGLETDFDRSNEISGVVIEAAWPRIDEPESMRMCRRTVCSANSEAEPMRSPAASASLALFSRTGPVMGTLRSTKRYRGWDLNPHGPQGPTDFRTTPIFIGGCVAWTFSSPYPAGRRCCPSSLCTFPGSGLAQDYQVKGFPDVEQFYAGRFRPGTHSISPLRLPIPPPRQIGDSCISTRRDVVRSHHHSSPVEHRPNTCASPVRRLPFRSARVDDRQDRCCNQRIGGH